ncbi:MAG: hypothetical protein ABEI52_00575, partial [Halobacteriaceae archaeon]
MADSLDSLRVEIRRELQRRENDSRGSSLLPDGGEKVGSDISEPANQMIATLMGAIEVEVLKGGRELGDMLNLFVKEGIDPIDTRVEKMNGEIRVVSTVIWSIKSKAATQRLLSEALNTEPQDCLSGICAPVDITELREGIQLDQTRHLFENDLNDDPIQEEVIEAVNDDVWMKEMGIRIVDYTLSDVEFQGFESEGPPVEGQLKHDVEAVFAV